MVEYKVVTGVEITSNLMRVVEVEHREGSYFLSNVTEKSINPLNVNSMVGAIAEVFNDEGFFGNVASIAIDTNFAEIDIVPIDKSLSPAELNDFLLAEIGFHLESSGEGYKIAYELMPVDRNSVQRVFYAGLPRQLIVNIREAFLKSGVDVKYIDLDHFCSELYLTKLVDRSIEQTFELVSVKPGRVESTLLHHGNRLGYRFYLFSGEPFYFVNKVVSDLEKSLGVQSELVFITGTEADSFLTNLLNKSSDGKVFQLVTDGQKLLKSPVVQKSPIYVAKPHLYSSAIGAAFK